MGGRERGWDVPTRNWDSGGEGRWVGGGTEQSWGSEVCSMPQSDTGCSGTSDTLNQAPGARSLSSGLRTADFSFRVPPHLSPFFVCAGE